ncbi:MAG: histidine--tRNA ligase [Chitinispirillaceae bacterium]|nr:histidine--tRNA ligase [Chitinispirillaceae bacterium]
MEIPPGPKGTRDFYPDLMAFQEHLFASWRRTCRRYAFEAWEAPMFEHLDIYTQKSGAEIEKQLYTFEDKGGRMMALRPEMTPSLARMVAAKGTSLKRPVRWYSIARLFRYEKMQKGRLREFFQLNMDILGSSEVGADAELIAAVIDMMRDLGLTGNDFQVRISSRTLLEECFCAIGLPKECFAPIYALLDRKNKITDEEYTAELAEIVADGQLRQRIHDLFSVRGLDGIAALTGATPEQAVLARLFTLLEKYGMSDYVCFDINIVRGLAYYTGIVFEVFAVNKGMRAIAGGGRYDTLVELYGGPPTPAVGFAAGDVVLGDLLQERGLIPPSSPRCSVFITALDDKNFDEVAPVARLLRNAGISCAFPFKRITIGKQLKQADAAGAVITLITGGDESAQGLLKLKRMRDGNETTVPRDKLLENIASMLEER